MEAVIQNLLEVNGQLTRLQLMQLTGLSDRAVRKHIAAERDNGADIVPVKPAGYKLAETDNEIKELENMYVKLGLKMFERARHLRNRRQSNGQVVLFSQEGKHAAGSHARMQYLLESEKTEAVNEFSEKLLSDFDTLVNSIVNEVLGDVGNGEN